VIAKTISYFKGPRFHLVHYTSDVISMSKCLDYLKPDDKKRKEKRGRILLSVAYPPKLCRATSRCSSQSEMFFGILVEQVQFFMIMIILQSKSRIVHLHHIGLMVAMFVSMLCMQYHMHLARRAVMHVVCMAQYGTLVP
jgi:hypothetical protein